MAKFTQILRKTQLLVNQPILDKLAPLNDANKKCMEKHPFWIIQVGMINFVLE